MYLRLFLSSSLVDSFLTSETINQLHVHCKKGQKETKEGKQSEIERWGENAHLHTHTHTLHTYHQAPPQSGASTTVFHSFWTTNLTIIFRWTCECVGILMYLCAFQDSLQHFNLFVYATYVPPSFPFCLSFKLFVLIFCCFFNL